MSPSLWPSVAECMVGFFHQHKSQFPVAKLPFPVGSEVSCGFRWGSNISEPPLRPRTFPEYPCMHTGICQRGHDMLQGKREAVLATCQGLIIMSLRQTSLPTAAQRWQWYLREPLMEIHIWTPGLRSQGHKPSQHEGGPFSATGW